MAKFPGWTLILWWTLINFDNKFQGGLLFQRGRLLDREEYAVCYVTENDGEEDKSDGTADEIYYLESLQEDLRELDDVDDDRNIFDVFDDEVSDDEEEEDISGERADN